jgi:excisionase family DNA binding protein
MARMVKVSQLARELGVHPRTVKRRIQEGFIEARQFGPRTWRITAAEARRVKMYGLNGIRRIERPE